MKIRTEHKIFIGLTILILAAIFITYAMWPENDGIPTVTATAEPTAEPTPVPTPEPTASPAETQTADPSVATAEPSAQDLLLQKFAGIDLEKVLFIGDSVTQGIDIYQPLPGVKVISEKGLSSYQFSEKLPQIVAYQPNVIFIMVGLNDMSGNLENEYYVENFRAFLQELKKQLPDTRIVVEALFPVAAYVEQSNPNVNNAIINAFNARLLKLANEQNVIYANVRSIFEDQNGYMRQEISPDGIHIYSESYLLWMEKLLPYMK